MPSRHELYWGDCRDKLVSAVLLRTTLAASPLDQETALCLARLQTLARKLADLMGAMGLGQVCAACAAKPNGGCCSRVIADENDALQLLMNLMIGVRVELREMSGHECCFLGEAGCTLAFKPIFCLNYDCAAIKEGCDRGAYARYAELRGRLLQAQWSLEQRLLRRLEELGVVH